MSSAAHNPWVALDVTTDPVAHARRLRRMHERGVTDVPGRDGSLRELVHESWKRSVGAGVLPDQGGAQVRLAAAELEQAREDSPLTPVVDVIHSTLSSLDEAARQIVAIGDERANLLWVTGDRRTCERAREMCFQEGAAWSEQEAGTNAVGTATVLDHAVQIFSAEHLVAAVHSWTCSAAPIHDPATGELIGVIDITADLRTNHPHTLSVAMLAARAAEAALQVRSLRIAERLRGSWEVAIGGRRTPSALIDTRGRVIASRGMGELATPLGLREQPDGTVLLPDGRTGELQALGDKGAILWLRRRSRRNKPRVQLRLLGHDTNVKLPTGRRETGLRSLELLAVLAMRREGMTTEQLALALYGEQGKAVTIRAQVHRVRAYLSEGALSTHPYRLNVPIDGDWLQVRRLITAGHPREALRAYPGPLLPDSEAPEIVEARALLDESLRRSILTSADPDLLMRWLEHPSGADDLAAARTLVALLPCGDPRRAAATATAAAIARRLSPRPTTKL